MKHGFRNILILFLTIGLLWSQGTYAESAPSALQAEETQLLRSSAAMPEIQASSACLMEAHTGTLLYSKDADSTYYPASTTKVMTALVVLENCSNLQDIVTFSNAAVNEIDPESSRIGAMVGEQLTVEQALYGLMLKSGNDCGVALAEYIAGSEAAFAEMMNAKAAEIGCKHTHFVNSHGLTDPNHYTTAHDLALIMRAATKNETFNVIDSTYSYVVPSTNLRADGFPTWYMGNKMINPYNEEYYEGVISGKTGFTDEAGNTLVTYAKRGDMELICVIMKSNSTHYSDTKILYNYGFENYHVFAMKDAASAFTTENLGFYASLDGAVSRDVLSIEQVNDSWVVLPMEVGLGDITSKIRFGEKQGVTRQIAELVFQYGDVEVGKTALVLNFPDRNLVAETMEVQPMEEETEQTVIIETQEVKESAVDMLKKASPVPLPVLGIVVVLLVALVLLFLFLMRPAARKRRASRKRRREYMKNSKKYY